MILPGFIITGLYARLLSFYPRTFRQEYSSEMQAVFEQALDEASATGQAAAFVLKELRDWPLALLRIYLQERRIHNMSDVLYEKPIRWWGLLIGIGLFALPILYHVSSKVYHNVLSGIFLLSFLIFVLGTLLFGIFKGLQRWCLPSFGMVLGGVWMYAGLQWIGSWLLPQMNRIIHIGKEASRYTWQAIMGGMFWVPLFLLLMIFVLIFAILPPLRPLYRRIRSDWTLVSFTLFGAILLALFIDWDEYTHEEVFVAACYLFLAMGAAGYLLSKSRKSRIIWLLGGAFLAMFGMAVGKFILVPLQDWPQWFQWHTPGGERWFESLRSLIELGWILLTLLAPSALVLLPPAREPIQEIQGTPQQAVKNSAVSASLK